MEQKSFRINTKIGSDTNIKIQLKEKYNTLDILSLKIADRDIYQTTSSDWGIVIGRVNGNGSVGIPNVKVSIFIPIDEVDASNPEILSIYPFLNVEDTTRDGTRYNLLPRLQGLDRLSGWVSNIFKIGYKPKTAVGTFPSKDDLLSNPTILKVYEKYYRYTTTTNQSGDFMLFGVPIGQQTIHIDTDLTDIGQFSMTPLVLQKKANKDVTLFSEDGNDIVKSSDLSTLPNIESQNQVINVIPFWGDKSIQEIGITRKDFKLKAELIPNFTVIGSGFTMGEKSYWGDRIVFRLYLGLAALCFRILGRSIRIRGVVPIIKIDAFKFEENNINGGIRDEEPFSITILSNSFKSVCIGDVYDQIKCGLDSEVTAKLEAVNHRNGDIKMDVLRYSTDGELSNGEVEAKNIDKFSVVGANDKIYFSENGQFGITLFCNREKKITNELGDFVTSDNNDGIFTSFVGYFIVDLVANIEGSSTNFVSARTRLKIPQSTIIQSRTGSKNSEWIRESFKFEFGQIYSVAQLFYVQDNSGSVECNIPNTRAFENYVGLQTNSDEVGMVCNDRYANLSNDGGLNNNVFTNQWLNFCLYFPQFIYKNKKKRNKSQVCNLLMSKELLYDNAIPLGGGLTNTKFFINGSNFKTNFIKIPKEDFINILTEKCDKNKKGFTSADFLIPNADIAKPIKPLIGNYKFTNHQMPNNGFNNPNNIKYFFRGIKSADCFIFAINKGIIQ